MPFHAGSLVCVRKGTDILVPLGQVRRGDLVETSSGFDEVTFVETFKCLKGRFPFCHVASLRVTADEAVRFGGDEWIQAIDMSPDPVTQSCNRVVRLLTRSHDDVIIDGVSCMQRKYKVFLRLRGMMEELKKN